MSGRAQGALSNGSCRLRVHNYINCDRTGGYNDSRVCDPCMSVYDARVRKMRGVFVCLFCDAAHPDDKSYAPNNDTGESTVTGDPLKHNVTRDL